jgi:hypothetical protein
VVWYQWQVHRPCAHCQEACRIFRSPLGEFPDRYSKVIAYRNLVHPPHTATFLGLAIRQRSV